LELVHSSENISSARKHRYTVSKVCVKNQELAMNYTKRSPILMIGRESAGPARKNKIIKMSNVPIIPNGF
jgi:hypothetical protein